MENVNTKFKIKREDLKKYDEKVKNGFSKTKEVILTVGGIATVALLLCPLDGPFGEAIAFVASGGLYLAVDVAEKIYNSVKDIPNKDTKVSDNVNDIVNNIEKEKKIWFDIKKIAGSFQKTKVRGKV